MPKAPRMRFTLSIDGSERELFSIQEREDESLIIFRRIAPSWKARPDDGLSPMRHYEEQHWSVHHSSSSSGTTITQKSIRKDGGNQSRVAFVHNTSAQLLWPLFATKLGYHAPSTNVVAPRKGDQTFALAPQMGSFDRNCFLYAAFVARPAIAERFWPRATNRQEVRFKQYQILVFSNFLHLGSLNGRMSLFVGTSDEKVDKISTGEAFQLKKESIPPESLPTAYKELMVMLAKEVVASGVREYLDFQTKNPSKVKLLTADQLFVGFSRQANQLHMRAC